LLSRALDVPLRDRNELLIAAGYAPIYRQTDLAAPAMAQVRRALDFILRPQEPYPALVLDRHWDVLAVNEGSARVQAHSSNRPRWPRSARPTACGSCSIPTASARSS